ncbi:MAG: SRPBCC domain-containing protein [Agarilytica sp.]
MIKTEPDGTKTICVDYFFPHSREKVWRALTQPELLAKWWATGNIQPTEGHEFNLDMDNWGLIPCKMLKVNLTESLQFSFGKWTIVWQLKDESSGTRLYLEQRGLDPNHPQDKFAIEHMEPGWSDIVFPNLENTLDEI